MGDDTAELTAILDLMVKYRVLCLKRGEISIQLDASAFKSAIKLEEVAPKDVPLPLSDEELLFYSAPQYTVEEAAAS